MGREDKNEGDSKEEEGDEPGDEEGIESGLILMLALFPPRMDGL